MKRPKAGRDLCIYQKEGVGHVWIRFQYVLKEDYKQVYSELDKFEKLGGSLINGLTWGTWRV